MNFIDLFAGSGGLSEGFLQQGFNPVAHVEMDASACDTLKTRAAYHYLKSTNQLSVYHSYLRNEITRSALWNSIPLTILNSVICSEISQQSIPDLFRKITRLIGKKKVDLIIGGPPCQAYSLVGRSRDPDRMRNDERNFLFKFYGEFLKKYKPKYFLFENVLGLKSAGNEKYLNEMMELFHSLGYSVDFKILSAEKFGVLQKRKRIIIIGRRGKQNFIFPELNEARHSYQIKRDLFYDLPTLKPGQELHIAKYTSPINEYLEKSKIRNCVDFVTQHITRNHNERDLEIYLIAIRQWLQKATRLKYDQLPQKLQTHAKKNIFLDRFKVVNPTGDSHTIVAHIAKDGHYYIYPDLKQIRSISVREAARIQSFPDDYFFEGGRTAAFRQIGNAVPPLMAEKLARSLKILLSRN